MDEVRIHGRAVIYPIYGVIGLTYTFVSIFTGTVPKQPVLFSVEVAVWLITMAALFHAIPVRKNEKNKSREELKKRAFPSILLTGMLIISSLTVVTYQHDYLLFIFFGLEWLMVIFFVTLELLNVVALFQIFGFVLLYILSAALHWDLYYWADAVVMLLFIGASRTLAGGIVSILNKVSHAVAERENSMGDLLNLAAAKNEEAKAASRSKTAFLSSMSHEIRTPINTVLGMDEMILREAEEENIRNYAENIKNSGSMLLALINDVLDFSKIESGRMELEPEEYILSDVLVEVYKTISPMTESKGLEFYLHIQSDLKNCYVGDDVRLKQVLVNLLTNACKYTPSGSVVLRVSGKNTEGGANLSFSVTDTGFGIKPEDIEHLNQEYVRVDSKNTHHIEGTGLGLSIVSRFLKMMKSKLEIESEYGKGSTFFFTIFQPFGSDAAETVGDIRERLTERRATEMAANSFIAPDAEILVVDDNPLNTQVFTGLLKRIRCKIDIAESGKTALQKTAEKRYDLIFMDHMMPVMDGIETFERMKEMDGPNKDTKVLILTANAVNGAKEMYLETGFAGYLSKPVSGERLEEALKTYLPRDLIKPAEPGETREGKTAGRASEKAAETPDFSKYPHIEGLDWDIAWSHMVDEEMLQETIRTYVQSLPGDIAELKRLYGDIEEHGDLVAGEDRPEGYADRVQALRIKVHSMKSSANLVGIIPLAGMAATIEMATRDFRMEFIKDVVPHFIKSCEVYDYSLSHLYKDKKDKASFDAGMFLELMEEQLEAISNLDIDEADRIMGQLWGFELPPALQPVFNDLVSAEISLNGEKVQELLLKAREILGITDGN